MTPPAQINCPHCGQPNMLAPQTAGAPMQCGSCGRTFPIVPKANLFATVSAACGALLIVPFVCGFAVMTDAMHAKTAYRILLCMPIVYVLAIVFGVIGLRKAKTPSTEGRGAAKAGIITGILGL